MKKIFAFLILLIPITSFSQKAEELQNSYNLKRGAELLFADTPDESGALECFRKELAEHPKNGYAYYYSGLIYDNNEQEGDALECFNKAVDLLKKDKDWIPFAYRMRAEVYLKLGHEDLALADWKSALKENPKDIATLTDRGDYYYDKDEFDLSDADYSKIIAINPGRSLGYNGKGRNAIGRKDYQKAIDFFNYSVNLAPNESYAYSHRAEAYFELKKFNEASDDIIKALDIDRNSYAYIQALGFKSPEKDILLAKLRIQQAKDKNNELWSFVQGIVYEVNDEYQKAINAFNDAIEINSQSFLFSVVAQCYAELGKYKDALDNIDRAIVMDSTNSRYLLDEGNYLYELGLTRDAIASISTYIEKNPDQYLGYYRRAFIKDCSGDIDGAIEDYTTTLVLNPDYNYALVERGDCYKAKGNNDAAIADFNKAIETDTVYNEDCCVQYAYLGLGQKDKAIEVQDSIFAHAQDKGTYYDAACLYSRMGKYDKAVEYFKTALEKGFRRFTHIANDRDLDGIRNREDFKALVAKYKAAVNENNNKKIDLTGIKEAMEEGSAASTRVSEIPFTREDGGLCKVKCNINGLPLNFWLDTGASDVSLSMVEATFMLKNGYLTKDDVVGSSYFLDANGNVSEGTILNLRKVTFGDSELTNVKASVVSNLRAPLLLGQSILARLGSVEIDNAKQVIRIKYFK